MRKRAGLNLRELGRENICVLWAYVMHHIIMMKTSVGGEIILLGNKKTDVALPIYWKSGVIRKVCTLPTAVETRALMRLVDDGTSLARQLMNIEVKTRVFTDSRPLLESIGRTKH